ncbi:hypothetical protein QSJ18_18110 [Gordonia sp. ABSL1-1]|uniref:hypothetical protein n=1 Tax=Gordonia sp. ABSL1-1 TaxID=3053923 RepID=UPI0025739535|nr:hypothetical protein [Gordonia sp. ABSL1-1]MDL9938664.1 hypothetical protein [Gordonia sp. ABSL1-1]
MKHLILAAAASLGLLVAALALDTAPASAVSPCSMAIPGSSAPCPPSIAPGESHDIGGGANTDAIGQPEREHPLSTYVPPAPSAPEAEEEEPTEEPTDPEEPAEPSDPAPGDGDTE